MSEIADVLKNRIFLIIILCISVTVAAVAAVAHIFHDKEKEELSTKVSLLSQERGRLSQNAQKMRSLLAEKENALALAQTQNFQSELLAAQVALKEAKDTVALTAKEKSSSENTNFILENRLKNTSSELTKALGELKKAREILDGIDGKYSARMSQLTESVKSKDQQLLKLEEKIKEGPATDIRKRGAEAGDSVRKYQQRISELEKSVEDLNRSLDEKDRMLSKAAKSGSGTQVVAASFEKERFNLEKQIADSSSKLFDQQEQLQDLEKKVADLNDAVSQRESQLAKGEMELKEKSNEIESLKSEVISLRSMSYQRSETGPILSETQKQLQNKVRGLEMEKRLLEDKLEAAQQLRAGKGEGTKDIFADRSFRILTETMVKKEEQIKQMEAELNAFKSEQLSREGGAGLKEQRLRELEILVNTLTKQLGEYAGMLEKKDIELKADHDKIAALTQDVEAQKIASIALQRELGDARARQDKTFQSLTQIMGMNSNAAPSAAAPTAADAANPGQAEIAPGYSDNLPPIETSEDAKIRVDELRKRVEVLLEGKDK